MVGTEKMLLPQRLESPTHPHYVLSCIIAPPLLLASEMHADTDKKQQGPVLQQSDGWGQMICKAGTLERVGIELVTTGFSQPSITCNSTWEKGGCH